MTFVQAIQSGFKNYVNFQGRARRSAFWWWVLFYALLMVIPQNLAMGEAMRGTMGVGTALADLLALGLFLPNLGVTVRRLHDTNRSGWWVLLGITIIGLIPLIIWYCQKSDLGPNKYGVGDTVAQVANTFN